MKTKIALCQLLPIENASERNFSTISKTIVECAKSGVKLCIFPEDFLYGVLRDKTELIKAGKEFNNWIDKFRELAKQNNISIIPGSFPLYDNNQIFNSTVYIDNTGQVLCRYSKNNLWLSERNVYQPGTSGIKSFDSVLGKTAIIICWDIFDHRLFENAVKQNVKWVVILSFWSINQPQDLAKERGTPLTKYKGFSDSKIIDSLIQARVSEYNLGIIFCNFAGIHKYAGKNGTMQKAISANRTQIMTPFNKISRKLTNRKEAVLFEEISSIEDIIKDFEIYYGRRSDIHTSYPYNLRGA